MGSRPQDVQKFCEQQKDAGAPGLWAAPFHHFPACESNPGQGPTPGLLPRTRPIRSTAVWEIVDSEGLGCIHILSAFVSLRFRPRL